MTWLKRRAHPGQLALLCGLLILPACDTMQEPDQVPPRASSAPSTAAVSHDGLIGWYQMTGGDAIIPIFKVEGTYYSVCRGVEVPLKECLDGLKWALTPSSMEGTKIGYDKSLNKICIIIEDSGLEAFAEDYVRGRKQFLTRIDKPSGLLDATALPPLTSDDFVGWYQYVWLPVVLEVRKDGARYLADVQYLGDASRAWDSAAETRPAIHSRQPMLRTLDDPTELLPLSGAFGLGFDGNRSALSRRGYKFQLIYNQNRRRFEHVMQAQPLGSIIRMPLIKCASQPSAESLAPFTRIGIPSYKG